MLKVDMSVDWGGRPLSELQRLLEKRARLERATAARPLHGDDVVVERREGARVVEDGLHGIYSRTRRMNPPVAVPSNTIHSLALRYVSLAGEPLYTFDEHDPVTSVFVTVTYCFTTG